MRTVIEFYQFDEERELPDVYLENVDIKDIFAQLNNEFILVYPMEKANIDWASVLNGNDVIPNENLISNTGAGLIIRPIDIKRIYNEI
jgi:hypothetical protein